MSGQDEQKQTPANDNKCDNTRDCAKCGLLAAGGSADLPHPHLPPVWVRLYAAAGHFAQRSWRKFGEYGPRPTDTNSIVVVIQNRR